MKTLTQRAIEVCETKRTDAKKRQVNAGNKGSAKHWQNEIARLDGTMRRLVKRANG